MTVDPDPLLGRIIAERYEIVSLINAGGMGVVYRAKQRSLDRPVAIKFVHPQFLGSDVSVQRFMEEARAVSRMNHPHVVSVFDFGRTPEAEGGYLFLVMELLTGPDLAKVLGHERLLPLRRVVSIVVQTLEALAEAHHLGIVHRDVKPENIVLEATRSGQDHVKVIDFGIAKNEASTSAEPGLLFGTPSYMAPEQKAGVAGPSADIYATGVMLFEMLAGQLPAKDAAPLSDPGSTLHLDPRRVAPRRGIPEALAAACARALQPDPARRFADAQAFASALRAAMSGMMASEPSPFVGRAAPLPSPKRSHSATLPAPTLREEAPSSTSVDSIGPDVPRVNGGVPLCGREDDLSWACAMLRSETPPPAIAFWGRAGIGRSRLLREVAVAAEAEGTLVVTTGLPPHPSGEVGYVGLRHIVRGLCGLTPAQLMDERAVGVVDRWALTGLRVLFSRAKAPAEPNVARRTAEAALAWALGRAMERASDLTSGDRAAGDARDSAANSSDRGQRGPGRSPSEIGDRGSMDSTDSIDSIDQVATAPGRVLLVLDDLDRLDGASFLALRDLLQSVQAGGPQGWTVLVASQHARTVMLLAGVRERALRGLSREDAQGMLAALSVPEELPRADDDIEPLYVAEVAASGAADVRSLPASLEEVIARRMQALTMGQRRILQALAVVGVHHVENLGILLRHPGDLDSALESLIDAGWIERRGAHVLLRHDVYGAVAVAGAPAGTVAAIHKAAAHQLRDSRQLSELRAYHAIQGVADFEAFVMLEDVARQRSARGDDDGAIAALTRAVSAARVQVMLGETAAASAALGVFGRKLAAALVTAERMEEAQSVLEEILATAEPRAFTRACVLEQLAVIADLRGLPQEADRRRREALEVAERTDDQNLKARLRDALTGPSSGVAAAAGGRPEWVPARTTAPPPLHGQRPVLIVEDDRSIREGLQSVLESEGYQAFGAGNGREALDLLRSIPRPGLILLDLMMPVMSGWEVLEALRADDEFSSIPVVVVSAVSERGKVAASRVLRKPVEVGMLLNIVEEFCA